MKNQSQCNFFIKKRRKKWKLNSIKCSTRYHLSEEERKTRLRLEGREKNGQKVSEKLMKLLKQPSRDEMKWKNLLKLPQKESKSLQGRMRKFLFAFSSLSLRLCMYEKLFFYSNSIASRKKLWKKKNNSKNFFNVEAARSSSSSLLAMILNYDFKYDSLFCSI